VDGITHQADRLPSFAASYAYMTAAAWRIIAADPWRYAAYHIKGVITIFLDPERFDLAFFFVGPGATSRGFLVSSAREGLRGIAALIAAQSWPVLLAMAVAFAVNLLKTAGFVAFHFLRNIPTEIKLTLAMPVWYIALATGPLGAGRFLLPVLLLVIAAAALSYDRPAERRGRSRNPGIGALRDARG
jgi:hypothetical protein